MKCWFQTNNETKRERKIEQVIKNQDDEAKSAWLMLALMTYKNLMCSLCYIHFHFEEKSEKKNNKIQCHLNWISLVNDSADLKIAQIRHI